MSHLVVLTKLVFCFSLTYRPM